MAAELRSGRFWFVTGEDRPPKPRPAPTKLNWSLDGALERANAKLPGLGAAPIASWVLARLNHLMDGGLQTVLDQEQGNPGGGYSLKFTVLGADSTPIATFSMNGNMNGVSLFGNCSKQTTPTELVTLLVQALIENPDEVAICRIVTRDTSPLRPLGSSHSEGDDNRRNYYGWDGEHYLGEQNTR